MALAYLAILLLALGAPLAASVSFQEMNQDNAAAFVSIQCVYKSRLHLTSSY